MANTLFVGFGLSKLRLEAVSKNTLHLVGVSGKRNKSSIYNIGYDAKKPKKGMFLMFSAVLSSGKIQKEIIRIAKKKKVTHIYDTFVLPGASLIFTVPLIAALPDVKFIKEIHNSHGFSRSFGAESFIRFFLNTKKQIEIVRKKFDIIVSRNKYLSTKYNGLFLPPVVRVIHKKRPKPKDKKIRVCFLGHPLKKKGVETMIELLGLLPKNSIDDITFTFAMSNIGNRLDIKKRINKISKIKKISARCLGNVSPELFFREQDVLCLPLKDEFSSAASFNTVLEAMEAGCMVLTTATNISKAILKHNKNGILVKKSQASSILRVLNKLRENKLNISKITDQARADIIEHYSMKQLRKVMTQIYD